MTYFPYNILRTDYGNVRAHGTNKAPPTQAGALHGSHSLAPWQGQARVSKGWGRYGSITIFSGTQL